MYQSESYPAYFDGDYQPSAILTKCQFGRFPILPLSPTMASTISDGSLSDDSCSPVTPLDSFNLSLRTLGLHKVESLPSPFEQHCMPMSELYIPPAPLPASDIESSSPSPSPVSESSKLPQATFLEPITGHPQSPPSPKKRDSPAASPLSPRPVASAAKKPRLAAERIRAKDFVPPDTSGLSKREARLVKNRAAAFLSRQRKREEFEAMEARLADLERENTQLLTHNDSDSPSSPSDDPELKLQLSSLQSMLAASEQREESLRQQLELLRLEVESQSSSGGSPSPSSESGSSASSQKEQQGSSLGLMVLLSLSTLLSSSSSPSSSLSSIEQCPSSAAICGLDAQTSSNWQSGFTGALDCLNSPATVPESASFCASQTGEPEFDISCTPSTDGKIRVRIHRGQAPEQASTQDETMMLWDSSDISMSPVGANDFSFMDDSSDAFSSFFPTSLDSFSFPSALNRVPMSSPKKTGSKRMRITLSSAKLQDDGAELEVEVR